MTLELAETIMGIAGGLIGILLLILGYFLKIIHSDTKKAIEEVGKNKGRIELVEQQLNSDVKRLEQTSLQKIKKKTMLKYLYISILSIFLYSCSCDYHMTRIKKKCPHVLEKDTLLVHDTVRISQVKKDTVFKFDYFQKDTVIIKEGRLTMKYFYNTTDSTVYLTGKCDTIRIIREIPVPIEKTVFKYDFLNSNKFLFALILLLLSLILIVYLFKKK